MLAALRHLPPGRPRSSCGEIICCRKSSMSQAYLNHSPDLRMAHEELVEIVERLGRDLTRLAGSVERGDVPPALVDSVYRGAHSLKGVSGLSGHATVSDLARSVESLLDLIRLGRAPLDAAALEVLDAAIEALGELVRGGGGACEPDLSSLRERLAACRNRTLPLPPPIHLRPDLPEGLHASLSGYERHRLEENIRAGRRLYLIRASLPLERCDRDLESLLLQLGGAGEVICTATAPAPGRMAAIDFQILFGADLPPSPLPGDAACDEMSLSPATPADPASAAGGSSA